MPMSTDEELTFSSPPFYIIKFVIGCINIYNDIFFLSSKKPLGMITEILMTQEPVHHPLLTEWTHPV